MNKGERKAINIKWSGARNRWEIFEYDNESKDFVFSGAFGVLNDEKNGVDYVDDNILMYMRDWEQNGYTVRIF